MVSNPVESKKAPSESTVDVTAARLHATALDAFRLGNRGRLELSRVLVELSEARLVHSLGFPRIDAYAMAHFDMTRSSTYEHIRVARALDSLPVTARRFGDGALGWTVVREIARVATHRTEKEWIAFAKRRGPEALIAEARDAFDKGRDTPRGRSFGLPNLVRVLKVQLSSAEYERVRVAFATIGKEMPSGETGEPPRVKDVLLYLADRVIAGGTAEVDGVGGSGDSPVALVYQQCTDCRRAGMQTREGLVEVPTSEAEQVVRRASTEVLKIDRPTPPKMRRDVLIRDGVRCSNPCCANAAVHAHHIVFRSRGGRTAMPNLIAVCEVCHALIHDGLLEVSGRGGEDVTWTPRVPRKTDDGESGSPESSPKTDVPKTDVPKTDVPKTDVPKTDVPKTDVPKTDVPKTDVPKTDVPKTDVPKTDVPKTDVPGHPSERAGHSTAVECDRRSWAAVRAADRALRSDSAVHSTVVEFEPLLDRPRATRSG